MTQLVVILSGQYKSQQSINSYGIDLSLMEYPSLIQIMFNMSTLFAYDLCTHKSMDDVMELNLFFTSCIV